MKKLLLTIFGAVLLSVGLMAQTITPIPPGGTWSTARGIINANDEIASDSMAILQLLKAPLASPTFTGTVSLPATWRINAVTVTSNAQELNILDGGLVTYQELNKLVGIGTDTIATRAYARLVGGGGGGTGDVMLSDSLTVFVTPTQLVDSMLAIAGGVVIGDVRDEIADSLNVLRPLVVHVADTASMLTSYINRADTASMLTNYINKADTASMLTPYINRADTATMLTPYINRADTASMLTPYINRADTASMLSPYAHNTYFESRVDSIVGVLADTANIETLFQIDLDTDTIADLSELRLKLNLADTASMLTHYALISEIGAASTDSAVYATRYYVINSYLADADTASMLTPYINRADTASMLTNYINKADTAGMLTNYITSVEVSASYATKTSAHLHADTIPLFVFGGGGGNAGDTTTFTTSTIYGSFYNAGSDSLRITELRVIMIGDATDTLSVDVLWDVNLNDGTPTELNADPLPVNSFTTGDTDTSFGTAKIPPGVWVWCETPGVVAGRKPTYFNAQISGYKIPKY